MNSSITYTKPISAPIKKGDELGKLIINIDGKPKIEVPLLLKKMYLKSILYLKFLLQQNT